MKFITLNLAREDGMALVRVDSIVCAYDMCSDKRRVYTRIEFAVGQSIETLDVSETIDDIVSLLGVPDAH